MFKRKPDTDSETTAMPPASSRAVVMFKDMNGGLHQSEEAAISADRKIIKANGLAVFTKQFCIYSDFKSDDGDRYLNVYDDRELQSRVGHYKMKMDDLVNKIAANPDAFIKLVEEYKQSQL